MRDAGRFTSFDCAVISTAGIMSRMENLETRARAQCLVDISGKRRFASDEERRRAVDRYWPAVAAEIVGDIRDIHAAAAADIEQLAAEYRTLRREP